MEVGLIKMREKTGFLAQFPAPTNGHISLKGLFIDVVADHTQSNKN